MTNQNKKTGVIGAGLMGKDITGLLANAGYEVTLVDVDKNALRKAEEEHKKETIQSLEKAGIKKREDITSLINYSTDIEDLSESVFIVEAISEKLEHKIKLMNSLKEVINDNTIIGTNTSTLTPTDISKDTGLRERTVLFHFANPAIQRKLVEISGDKATKEAIQTAVTVGENIEKTPIVLNREKRGHGLSRISASIKCSASWELLKADPEEIDRGAKALGFQRGPIELIDLIGIDVHLETVSNLSEVYDEKFEPPEKIKEKMTDMLKSGKLGEKTGEGFYEWESGEPIIPATEKEHDITPIIAALVNESHKIVGEEITNRNTLDKILKLGSGGSMGAFEVSEMFGKEKLRKTLKEKYKETKSELFKPAKSLGD